MRICRSSSSSNCGGHTAATWLPESPRVSRSHQLNFSSSGGLWIYATFCCDIFFSLFLWSISFFFFCLFNPFATTVTRLSVLTVDAPNHFHLALSLAETHCICCCCSFWALVFYSFFFGYTFFCCIIWVLLRFAFWQFHVNAANTQTWHASMRRGRWIYFLLLECAKF